MPPDQIRQIAEEYAKYVNSVYLSEGAEKEALRVIKWLTKRFCVVEREEVFRLHNNAKMLEWDSNRDFNIIGKAAIKTLEGLFGTSMFNPKEAEYTDQCQNCMRKLAGEILEVCRDSNDEYRHCKWDCSKNRDFCVYKIFWDRYPESYWQSILSSEQFAKAKSLNEDKE